jgi:hypothetical protein
MISCRSLLTRRHSRNLSESRILSSATIVPEDGVVADVTSRKDKLCLIPGNAVGTAAPEGIPVCYRSTRQTGRLCK